MFIQQNCTRLTLHTFTQQTLFHPNFDRHHDCLSAPSKGDICYNQTNTAPELQYHSQNRSSSQEYHGMGLDTTVHHQGTVQQSDAVLLHSIQGKVSGHWYHHFLLLTG